MKYACVDVGRCKRIGFPEVIFAQGKTPAQIRAISKKILKASSLLLLTKLDQNKYRQLKKEFPALRYEPSCRIGYIQKYRPKLSKGLVCVITGGTGDIPAAEEACITLEILGHRFLRLYDVGVAGIHRVLNRKKILRSANVLIVVAGMEGALASVVAGIVSRPVIAVPTSVGYGANFKGVAPLLTMLNSCAPGVAVVNIDNGFGAGYLAHLINK